jgi:membrane protein
MARRTLAHDPWKLGGLPVKDLARRTWQEITEDDLPGRAAQLAYYFLLALFPALLFLSALVGLFPLHPVIPDLMANLRRVLPSEALSLMEKYLQQVVEGSSGGILSLGFLGALWASSSGMTAIMETWNVAYDVPDTRPLWRVRLIAIAMTVGLAGFIIVSSVLVLAGEHIGTWVAEALGLGSLFRLLWILLQWPVVMAFMLFALAVIYAFAPNVRQGWRWVTPGSLFAVAAWLAVSLAFKLYAENFGHYNAAYGSIAGVIVLMLWFYLSGMVLLIGGEINAEIARAANPMPEQVRLADLVRNQGSATQRSAG